MHTRSFGLWSSCHGRNPRPGARSFLEGLPSSTALQTLYGTPISNGEAPGHVRSVTPGTVRPASFIAMASSEGASASKEGTTVWRDQCRSQCSSGFRPAVVLLACDYPNNMQSDLPLALHTVAERSIINHSVDAALTLTPSQILVTAARQHIQAIQQVVEKAHPHAACAFSFVGAEATGEYGEGITRKQRQTALSALAEDITEVVEWPCHWRITPEVARRLVSIGRKELEQCGAFCCSLNVMARSAPPRPQEHASKGKPHPLWATAAFWKGPLQGQPCSSSDHHQYSFTEAIGESPTIISDRFTLSMAEHNLRCSEIKRHKRAGVTFRDAQYGTFLSAGLEIGRDTVIGVGVQIYGSTVVGRNVRIEGPTFIKDSRIGDNCRIGAFSHLEQVTLASSSGVGPFARLRAGAAIDSGAYIGNFVELKGAHVGQGGNVCHLSYLGDADVGDRANIGAGTITCNYNGVAKNRTSIAADAFIGSNSTLVAPVTVGQGALIAAGSVITTDVPRDALALGRSRQTTLEHRANATREKLRIQEQQKK